MENTTLPEEEQPQQAEDTLYKLQLRFRKEVLLDLSIAAKDCLFELRNYIIELPNLYFQPGFHFEADGRKLNEYNELEKEIGDLDQQPIRIDVVLDEYDFRSAKDLVRRLNEFFRCPKKVIAKIRCRLFSLVESKANFIKLDFGNLLGRTGGAPKEKRKNLEVSKVLGDGLHSYPTYARDPWHRFGLLEKNLFVDSLEFSGWNPPPSKRRMVGDFFYLRMVTLEKEVVYLTAFSRGFYRNKSTDQVFDPSADSEPYFSLPELISMISPNQKYTVGLFDSVSVDLMDIPVNTTVEPPRWLRSLDEMDDHEFDAYRAAEDLYEMSQAQMVHYRDWNEEIQNYKKMDSRDFYDHLNKAKVHERIQKDFLEVALEGAKAIVEGRLPAMNVSSQQSDKCFIFQNVFFTFCSDDPLRGCQPRGEDAPAAVITGIRDLENASLLGELDGTEIHTVQTALVKYRGFCITAQSLIQGILYYDEKTWTKYGSVDEGKTISNDPEFSQTIAKISKLFHCKDNLVYIDAEGEKHVMTSPIDVKGIQGGDSRKYVLDLFRFSPRDLNWEGDENDAVVFRPKIVESYLTVLKQMEAERIRVEYVSEINALKTQQQEAYQTSLTLKAAQREKEKEADQTGASTQATPEEEALSQKTKDQLNQVKEKLQEIQTKMYQEIEDAIKEKNISDMRFDSSLYSGLESHYSDPAELEKEKNKLKDLAKFVREVAVKDFVNQWSQMSKSAPIDSFSLVEAMQTMGLSERYIGMVYKTVEQSGRFAHAALALRTLLVRSSKRFLEHVLRTIPAMQIPDTISHLINCIIGGSEISSLLEKKVSNLKKGQNVAEQPEVESKKKKKKKHQKVQQVKCDIEPNQYMLYSPKEVFDEVSSIAKARYLHEFSQSGFPSFTFTQNETDRASLLRELCLSIGLCLGFRDFKLEDQSNSQSPELPIRASDIGEFVAKINKPAQEFPYTKINYALGAQYVANGKIDAAVDVYSSTLQALLNIHGPCHPAVLEFASTLATILGGAGKRDQAISIQKSVVKLCEKTFGIDHKVTMSALMELGRVYYEIDNYERTLGCMNSALYLADLIGGSINTESLKLLEEIQHLYSEKKDFKNALVCAEELHVRYCRVFDKNSKNLVNSYYYLALYNSLLQNTKEATGYAQHRLAIISKHFKATMPAKVDDAKKFVNYISSGGNQGIGAEEPDEETMQLRERLHQTKLLHKRRG